MSSNLLDFSTHLIKKAGTLLTKYFSQQNLESDFKSDNSLVTEADLAADNLIRESIENAYPDDGILSEESGTIFPKNHDYVWVIDPLDGTTNFSLGLQYWGVSIARLKNGQLEMGCVYFPLINEFYMAVKGQGAFLNGDLIKIDDPKENDPKPFFACCSRTYKNYTVNIPYKTRILGAATYNLCAVANSVAILAFEATPKLWDIAAAWLIIQESGGTVQTLNKIQLFPTETGHNYEIIDLPTLAAASPALYKKSSTQLIPKT